MTWFRKEPGIHWISIDKDETPEQTTRRVVSCIDQFLGDVESEVYSAVGERTV